MGCTFTAGLRKFLPSYREWRGYHIAVCQANTGTNTVPWLTQYFGKETYKFQGIKKKPSEV
jgi:hypothetical protein